MSMLAAIQWAMAIDCIVDIAGRNGLGQVRLYKG